MQRARGVDGREPLAPLLQRALQVDRSGAMGDREVSCSDWTATRWKWGARWRRAPAM